MNRTYVNGTLNDQRNSERMTVHFIGRNSGSFYVRFTLIVAR